MMNGCEFDRPCAQPDLAKVAQELGNLGYEMVSTSEQAIKAKYPGKWITTDPAELRHFVEVAVAGEQLHFRFHTGLVASSWGKADQTWAEGRADQLIA